MLLVGVLRGEAGVKERWMEEMEEMDETLFCSDGYRSSWHFRRVGILSISLNSF